MGAKPRRGERIVHTGKVATAAGDLTGEPQAEVDNASKLGRKIALNPSEIRAFPAIAWRRALGTFRKPRALRYE